MKTLDWQVRLLQLVPSWEGQNGRRTPLVKFFLCQFGWKVFKSTHSDIPPRECTLLLVLPQPRWTWCLVGSRKSRLAQPGMWNVKSKWGHGKALKSFRNSFIDTFKLFHNFHSFPPHLHPAELGGDVEFALLGHQQHVPVAVVHRPVRHAEHCVEWLYWWLYLPSKWSHW